MAKVRVLVVDDAIVIRRVVTDILSADPELEVVGTAANGKAALARLEQLAPDLITLDIEMPEMDGLETLIQLRKLHPRLPVIMLSTLTERGAAATMEALARGASDYVTKPAHPGSATEARAQIRDQLIPKIKGLCRRPVPPRAAVAPSVAVAGSAFPAFSRALQVPRADVLAIGVSTGGPNALAAVLSELPADFPLPIVIVQHMPPVFTRFLAERLAASCRIEVKEAANGEALRPGVAWIAPGNFHMQLRLVADAVRIMLNQDSPENSCRPAVDPLFRAVARIYGAHSLGLVLTGMGQDGMLGAGAIRQAQGQVLAQDEASSVVWGMPGAVVSAGLADRVLPLDQIAGALIERALVGRSLRFAQSAAR